MVAKKKKPTTKAELAAEFETVARTTEMENRRPESDIAAEVAKAKAALGIVKDIKPDEAVRDMVVEGQRIQTLFQEAQTIVTGQLSIIGDLDTVIDAKARELEALYGKETVARSTSELIAEHKAKSADLALHYENEKKWLEHTQADAETAHARRLKEIGDEGDLKLRETEESHAREEETWKLDFSFQRKKAEADEKLRREAFERMMKEREGAVAAKEKEHADAITKIAAFPAEMEKAASDAVAKAKQSVYAEKNVEISLLKKDMDAAKREAEIRTSTYEATIKRLTEENVKLATQLEAQAVKVQSIAESALTAASGRQTLAELQSFNAVRENGAKGARG